jgi:hypothetical protein
MYSPALAALRSRLSAGRLKRDFQTLLVMNCRSGRMRVGRWVLGCGVVRERRRSRRRRPRG